MQRAAGHAGGGGEGSDASSEDAVEVVAVRSVAACTVCGARVALAELDGHERAHAGAAEAGGPVAERCCVAWPVVLAPGGARWRDGWSCGYQNVRLLWSALLRRPVFGERLAAAVGGARVPDVVELQGLLERAWAAGWDPTGARQLGRVVGTRRWVGTTEAWVILNAAGIDARIIDVPAPKVADPSGARFHAILAWAYKYFDACQDGALPVYLQHAGHARSIVGVRAQAREMLLWDPVHHAARPPTPSRCSFFALRRHKQYSLMFVAGVHSQDGPARPQTPRPSQILRTVADAEVRL